MSSAHATPTSSSSGSPGSSSQQHSSAEDAAAVALRGAALAFAKKPAASLPTSSATTNTYTYSPALSHGSSTHITAGGHPVRLLSSHARKRSIDALAAAERARSPARLLVQPHPPAEGFGASHDVESQNASLQAAGIVAARLQQLGVPNLVPTSSPQAADANSKLDAKTNPSLIAATLAASRSVSPSAANRKVRHAGAGADGDVVVDAAPIPPTTSLISMFESKDEDVEVPVVKTTPVRKQHKQKLVREVSPTGKIPASAVALPKLAAAAARPKRQSSPPVTSEASKEAPMTPVAVKTSAAFKTPVSVKTPVSAKPKKMLTPQAVVDAASAKPRVPAVSPTVKTPTKPKHLSQPKEKPTPEPKPVKVNTEKKVRDTLSLKAEPKPVSQPKEKPTPEPKPVKVNSEKKARDTPTLKAKPKPVTIPRAESPTPPLISRSTTVVLSPKPTRVVKAALRSSSPPDVILKPTIEVQSPPIILKPAIEVQSPPVAEPIKLASPQPKAAPTPPQPRRSQRFVKSPVNGRERGNSDTMSASPAVISMYGLPISIRAPISRASPPPLPGRRDSVASAPSSPSHEPQRRLKIKTPAVDQLQLNSLTSAIMAGSLASSRLTPQNSGSPMPPLLPKRQKSPHLLQTLRRPPSSDSDENERQKNLGNHHRHKLHSSRHQHHEGSRRRWRDKITDRERKRYEAVWASNRGLLLTDVSPSSSVVGNIGTELSECVVNVVVRELWQRSRLPDDELGEAWDLVDREGRGYLTRPEFVVGMWLVDQRLKGRKLPTRVGDSVWTSAYGGVAVARPRR
ncbi:hypothetical protein VHEMI02754 [[Torrubiella] hemipterigena]|uniref:Increased rDNA silencing protein 4 n=1 Tax=[Torrubiella] hemipterigena TaxID=1531966 RepID=A0A0A1T982_9HYPO|nr:hypothetical protein VHEMI02754 [[Torrubiella] hemipterigena]